jgi:hypothetical protein
MSEQSWLAEFYPYWARATSGDREAIVHSLQKWKGAIKNNLEKHQVLFPPIDFDENNCALCQINDGICKICDLSKSRDGVSCTVRLPSELMSPWTHYTALGNPHPMIEALEECLKFYDNREAESKKIEFVPATVEAEVNSKQTKDESDI